MPNIAYETEGFPAAAPIANGAADLTPTWSDLLWAGITVGRPNRQFVFQHGLASVYEALFRWSLIRMTLEETGVLMPRFARTTAARSLDPSEKGAVNYFLGMTLCKLFSAELLDAPWLLHLDVFRPQLDAVLIGRSRPDLVGQTQAGEWLAIESKGRISPPDAPTKTRAKDQALRCVSVGGVAVSYHIGGIAYFRNDVLRYFWRDPQPAPLVPENAIVLPFDDNLWQHYYRPARDLILSHREIVPQMLREPISMPVESVDLQLGIHPFVLKLLVNERWSEAKQWCVDHLEILQEGDYQPDGIRVIAGPSWTLPFDG